MNVALRSIQRDLGFSQTALAWIVVAYLLTFGGCGLLAGCAGDIVGRRRMLMLGSHFSCSRLWCAAWPIPTIGVITRGLLAHSLTWMLF